MRKINLTDPTKVYYSILEQISCTLIHVTYKKIHGLLYQNIKIEICRKIRQNLRTR